MPSAYERLQAAVLRGDEITCLPPVRPLIDGILDLDNIGTIYGRYGAGKSFLVLDWALCVVTGKPWWGHPVTQGKVLYVVGEGVTGTGPRYDAWCSYYGVETVGADMVWLSHAPNLLASDERLAFLRLVTVEQPTFTIMDTLARHLPGGDENTSPTMSAMVETMDEVKRITGGHALVVHHPGKADDAGARGHTSLSGAVDTELSCVGTRSEGRRGLILRAEKQKNREDGMVLARLQLHPVLRSCVLIFDPDQHPIAQKILDFLAEHPGAAKRELRELGNSDAVDRELAEMERNGTIRIEVVGTTHRHYLL